MTPLRQQMINAMQQRGFSIRTHQSYLWTGWVFPQITRTASSRSNTGLFCLSGSAQRALRLQLPAASQRHSFQYLQVLHWSQFDIPIVLPKKAQKIPELLTRQEVKQIIGACENRKHRMMLLTCYGYGLRVSELVALKVRHIDGERQLLRIEQGKGAKDRAIVIAETLLMQLRRYWLGYHPGQWLFPNSNTTKVHLSIDTAQKLLKKAKTKTGIQKVGGIHSLRHAYATHQLESGLAIHKLQHHGA